MSLGNLAGPSEFHWSPDGRSIVFSHQPTPHIDDWPRADVSVVDVASGNVRALAATTAAENDPVFSPDGKHVAFDVSDDPPTWRHRSRVAVVPVEGGTPRLLAETPDDPVARAILDGSLARAVASPVVVGLVARTTSVTSSSAARATSSVIFRSSGSIPSIPCRSSLSACS